MYCLDENLWPFVELHERKSGRDEFRRIALLLSSLGLYFPGARSHASLLLLQLASSGSKSWREYIDRCMEVDATTGDVNQLTSCVENSSTLLRYSGIYSENKIERSKLLDVLQCAGTLHPVATAGLGIYVACHDGACEALDGYIRLPNGDYLILLDESASPHVRRYVLHTLLVRLFGMLLADEITNVFPKKILEEGKNRRFEGASLISPPVEQVKWFILGTYLFGNTSIEDKRCHDAEALHRSLGYDRSVCHQALLDLEDSGFLTGCEHQRLRLRLPAGRDCSCQPLDSGPAREERHDILGAKLFTDRRKLEEEAIEGVWSRIVEGRFEGYDKLSHAVTCGADDIVGMLTANTPRSSHNAILAMSCLSAAHGDVFHDLLGEEGGLCPRQRSELRGLKWTTMAYFSEVNALRLPFSGLFEHFSLVDALKSGCDDYLKRVISDHLYRPYCMLTGTNGLTGDAARQLIESTHV